MNKLLLAGLMLLAPVSVASADLKVAVVDLGKAFDAYYKTKDASVRLQKMYSDYQKELQGLAADYEHMAEEMQVLDKAANDPALSDAARKDKTAAWNAKKQDLFNLQQKFQERKNERENEFAEAKRHVHQDIVGEISKVISDYSGPQGYDMVIDESSVSASSGASLILYNSNKLTDITADIITILNKSAPAPGAASPSASGAVAPAPAAPTSP
jgi:Skp family chaperone for outer membrane proteins